MKERTGHWPDLGALTELGFGPDAALMNEPRLLVDRRFLAALLVQFEQELGAEGSDAALFQIGLLHGFADAHRMLHSAFSSATEERAPAVANATPLAIRLGPRRGSRRGDELVLPGTWPECHEADARLSRIGPAAAPRCALSAGYTSGWLSGSLDADILVVEEECLACGDAGCRFLAREVEGWRASGHARANELISAIDFDVFRDMSRPPSEPAREESVDLDDLPRFEPHGDFERDAPVVHVWGPVMVLPFIGADEALATVDMLSRDASREGVCSVVVDLRDAILDEGYDAAALEQVLDSIEVWGAEAVLTGVCDLSENTVRGLETTHLLVRKDMGEAIATAFQIAEAQRHPL